ncbi:MAG: hypothetical protein PHX83_17520 [Acidobacteriia bacterium]|nr:hypothetical protein [Terriglobia bacterium]
MRNHKQKTNNLLNTLLIVVSFLSCGMLGGNAQAQPICVESKTIEFPTVGKVIVCALEEFDAYPSLTISNQKTAELLLRYSMIDSDRKIIKDDPEDLRPFIRFLELPGNKNTGPLILAITVTPGGSDSGFSAMLIGESNGKLAKLIPKEIEISVQGGIFVGNLNSQFGYGIVAWTFLWDSGAHYSLHPYEVEIYSVAGGKFRRRRKFTSKHKYHGNGAEALREVRITAHDLREEMPKVREYAQ